MTMTKTINIRMTAARARELGYEPRYELALCPVDVDLDALSPMARWIADHITATYVVDELRDVIGISAYAGHSMMERDMRDWRYASSQAYRDRVAAMAAAYAGMYNAPMKIEEIGFPVYGARFRHPEDIFEQTVRELVRAGAVLLKAANGDVYMM